MANPYSRLGLGEGRERKAAHIGLRGMVFQAGGGHWMHTVGVYVCCVSRAGKMLQLESEWESAPTAVGKGMTTNDTRSFGDERQVLFFPSAFFKN